MSASISILDDPPLMLLKFLKISLLSLLCGIKKTVVRHFIYWPKMTCFVSLKTFDLDKNFKHI